MHRRFNNYTDKYRDKYRNIKHNDKIDTKIQYPYYRPNIAQIQSHI